jgi:WD40 repeat protein
MADSPTVVLAFANDQEGRRYLRDLPEELRRLQEILRGAEANGLCRVELLPNASLDQIFDAFTRNRDRVAILHYGGHADSGRLLLESGAPAHAAGLATFLGQRGGLQLVFLNGCSTRAQVARLLEAGVAAVIATARAIDDVMAREFAAGFYVELASGASLRAAFEAARGRVLAFHDSDPVTYYTRREIVPESAAVAASLDPSDEHGFPWEFRPGTELVERWSLPDAAGKPEFGLPPLPECDLPEAPFRHLKWFTADEAEVFFGRGYQIRELYEQITDPAGPPILLLYGASGVGKSSLLDAGLVPRLEAGRRAVRYRRRDREKGLMGSLRDALQLPGSQTTLGAGWRAEEARLGTPVDAFLDQVEEVLTRPDEAPPGELDEFLGALVGALADRESRPRGKLVLGFRKEWLAEIDRRLVEAKLPRTKVFLKPLDRRGIIEAIRGPASPGRLRRQYRLGVEAGLPEVIADNLLTDAGSALAPTLQVLLTKMWERARQASPDEPRFDRGLYESLKAEGYLLKDVLDEGLRAIGEWDPTVEESGLALDVLAYHTTDLGTAAQHTRAELDLRYAHQADVLGGLLRCCKDQYLLIEAEPKADASAGSTRLAHDLLAPLVLQRFRLSVAPGQRARRLLENRSPEWRGDKAGPPLDSVDLTTVENGAGGMRSWEPNEVRLVEASREAEAQRVAAEQERARRLKEAEERQRQAEADNQRVTEQRLKDQEESNQRLRKRAIALAATLVVAVAAALVAANQWRVALKETGIADEKTKDAVKATRIATSRALAALSASERTNRLDRSLLLATEALTIDNSVEARSSLFDALLARPGLRSFLHTNEGIVRSGAFSPDGRILAAGFDAGGDRGGVVLWDVARQTRILTQPLAVAEGNVRSVAFSPDGMTLAAGYLARGGPDGVVLWGMARRTRLAPGPLAMAEGNVTSVAFSPDGMTLAAGYDGRGGSGASQRGGVVLWDVARRARLATQPLAVPEGYVTSVAFNPDGTVLVAGYVGGVNRGGVVLWDVARRARLAPEPLAAGEGYVTSVAFNPNGTTLAAGYGGVGGLFGGGGVLLWDVARRARLLAQPLAVAEGDVESVAYSPDGKTLAAGYFGGVAHSGVLQWDVSRQTPLLSHPLVVAEGAVWSLAFSSDGTTIATGYGGAGGDIGSGGVVLWDVARRARLATQPLEVAEGDVESVTFNPSGKILAAGYGDFTADTRRGGVVLWDVARRARLATQPLAMAEGSIASVAFNPNGTTLAAGYDGGVGRGGVVLWDVARRARSAPEPLTVPEGDITSVAFSPDGATIAAGYGVIVDINANHGGVVLWDVARRARLAAKPLTVDEGVVSRIAFSPDGMTLAAGYGVGGGGGVVLWDVARRTRSAPEPLPVPEGKVRSIDFGPDGTALVAGYGAGGVVIWDVARRARLAAQASVVAGEGVQSMAYNPRRKVLAVGYDGGVVGGARRGGVVLWDVAQRARLVTQPLAVDEGSVSSVAFSLDGKTLAAGYSRSRGGVVLWDVDLESWRDIAGRVANRNLTWDEWREYFPDEPRYHSTFPDLPEGAGVAEARAALEASRSGTPSAKPPAAPHP